MDFSAPHVGYVIACYLLSALVLGALAAVIVGRDRARRRRLDDLDARGAPRRRS